MREGIRLKEQNEEEYEYVVQLEEELRSKVDSRINIHVKYDLEPQFFFKGFRISVCVNNNSIVGITLAALKLEAIPEAVKNLKNLQFASFMNNNITQIPDFFSKFSNLNQLTFRLNKLTSITEGFGELKNLQILNLRQNSLTTLPDSFGELKNLKWLSIRDNDLKELPDSFGDLESLEFLNIMRNFNLTAFPESIINLTSLKALNMRFTVKKKLLSDDIKKWLNGIEKIKK